jgi:tetratricopeptide (TPR) repeat protein
MKTNSNFGKILIVMLMAILLQSVDAPVKAQVKTWEGTITIPTYGWENDVNPKFWGMEGGAKGSTTVRASIVYPYWMQDHLSRKLENVTYKAIYLENEYLKITCLPELGGRLHSVYDKTTNNEVFHKNSVIKPSMIGMRGAFISGGVEWNTGPQVHTVTILSPVNVISGTNPDGSAYLEVSNLEKSLRTQWTVRVTLHPGKAYLDEEMRIYNPTDAMNPYYFWNCTAFPQLPGTRFIYPMSLGTDHFGVEFFNWPVNKGNDLSWTKNYADAASIFAVNCTYDFFGAYDVDLDRGVIQVANHFEHSGKKAWTWGQGDYGRICQKNLTDTDGNYIEVQSGPMQTQSDYGILPPKSQVSWKEYWYPVHGLGDGFEFANQQVAFRTERKSGQLEIRIISTEKFVGASCVIYQNNKEIYTKLIDLTPEKAGLVSVTVPVGQEVKIVLKSSDGKELASYLSPLPLHKVITPEQPTYVNKPDNQLTIEETYLKAQKFDRALDRNMARKYYQMVLDRDSLHLNALRDLAILNFESAQYSLTSKMLEKALAQIPNDDGLAWYFLGLCNLKLNDIDQAIKCGYKASRCLGTVSIGFDLVGRGLMLQKKYQEAQEFFGKALQADQNNISARHHQLIGLYVNGQIQKAGEELRTVIEANPTDLTARALLAIIKKDPAGFVKTAREYLGEYDFEMMETVNEFSELGLYTEAAWIMEAACINGVEEGKQNFLIQYHLAFLNSVIGEKEKTKKYLAKAAGNYQDFVMASRPETIEVLEFAVRENPDDAQAWYQLGNLLGNFGRLDEAAVNWDLAVRLKPSMSIPWRNLGLYYWAVKNDHAKSEACFRNAISSRPFDQTLYRDLARVLLDNGRRPEAITLLENMSFKGARRSDIIQDLAQYYLDEKRFEETYRLLISTPYFVNWEGSTLTWDMFNQAHVGQGAELFNQKKYKEALEHFETALTWPENLGVGHSVRTEEALAWFWKGKTLLALGKSKEALAAWKHGSELPDGSAKQIEYRKMCKSLLE